MSWLGIIISYGMIMIGLFGGASFFVAGLRKKTRWQRLLAPVGAVLLTTGWLSFHAGFAAASGGLNWLPQSAEWPVGWSDAVVTTTDGNYAVPHVSASRVQVYDANWRFLRGYQTEAGGGVFRLAAAEDGGVEVFTARGSRHHVYDREGNLLLTGTYLRSGTESFHGLSPTTRIPTPWWGWTLTSPGIAWGIFMAGMLICAVTRANEGRKGKSSGSPTHTHSAPSPRTDEL